MKKFLWNHGSKANTTTKYLQVNNEKNLIPPIREIESKGIKTKINEKEIKQIKEDKNVGGSTSDEEKKSEVSRPVLVVLAATALFIVGLTVYGATYNNLVAPVLALGLGLFDYYILILEDQFNRIQKRKMEKNESSKNWSHKW